MVLFTLRAVFSTLEVVKLINHFNGFQPLEGIRFCAYLTYN